MERRGHCSLHPVGKSYASKVGDEKRLLSSGANTDRMGIKNPATSIVAAYADKGG